MVPRRGMTSAGVVVLLMILALAAVSTVYITSSQSSNDQLNSQNQQISALQAELQNLTKEFSLGTGTAGANLTLPVMNQAPTIRTIRETWYLSPSAHQDRFDPSFVIVNQGDTVRLTLIDNDTVAHDFVVGPPYNIIVNATVPGLINDLTGQMFTTPSRGNSAGCCGLGEPVITGSKGNVSATFSFVAEWSGIYEFVCTYHAQVGMVGYLVVLPNAAYKQSGTSSTATSAARGSVAVSIAQGAGVPPNNGFTPRNITVVIGVNNTVIWTNNDVSIHTVTSTVVPSGASPFGSGYLNTGGSFSYTFAVPGVYEYHCQIHPWMTGSVTVKA